MRKTKVRLLLDTHIYLWSLLDKTRLSKGIRSLILDAELVYVSSASIWEIGIKQQLKKIKLDVELKELVNAIALSGFSELSINMKHVVAAAQLPLIYKDPFDRLLLAQALSEPLKLLTADARLKQYSELVELI